MLHLLADNTLLLWMQLQKEETTTASDKIIFVCWLMSQACEAFYSMRTTTEREQGGSSKLLLEQEAMENFVFPYEIKTKVYENE